MLASAAPHHFRSSQYLVLGTEFAACGKPDAQVEIPSRGSLWTTEADGSYGGMAPQGTYEVFCSRTGFETQMVTIEVIEDVITVQDFQLNDIAGPEITDVDGPVATSDIVGPYQITARATDASTVTDVTLYWRVGMGVWQTLTMTGVGDLYSADIPGQPAHTAIDYYVQATDGGSLESTAPATAPTDFYQVVITETFYATEYHLRS